MQFPLVTDTSHVTKFKFEGFPAICVRYCLELHVAEGDIVMVKKNTLDIVSRCCLLYIGCCFGLVNEAKCISQPLLCRGEYVDEALEKHSCTHFMSSIAVSVKDTETKEYPETASAYMVTL